VRSLAPTKAGGAAGWWPTSRSCRWVGRSITPASWPATTKRIDLAVERLEASGRERTPRLVKWAVHATRKPKEHETPDTLYGRWRTEAAERGMDPDALVQQVTDRTRDREQDRTVSEPAVADMEAEGFGVVATCDRLLAGLDRGHEQLDSRTVLVVDEAGMLGGRKLARLLEHAEQARAKVVLVGDDRHLAAIDAGGGFRALRLRLGASVLVENRRQHQAWEREALELVRGGLVEEAVVAYRAHNRVVAAESKPAATLALLNDWWQAWQDAERDPTQDVIVLRRRFATFGRMWQDPAP
jgi:hypothetical protein